MGCHNRCANNINRNGQVMGEFGTTRIALRGPGCINGTGRCNVAGAQGRCTDRFGMGNDFVNTGDVMGESGNRRCFRDDVMGEGGSRRCFRDEVLGEGGSRRCNRNNVQGTGGRNRHWDCCDCLETPFTVPR